MLVLDEERDEGVTAASQSKEFKTSCRLMIAEAPPQYLLMAFR